MPREPTVTTRYLWRRAFTNGELAALHAEGFAPPAGTGLPRL